MDSLDFGCFLVICRLQLDKWVTCLACHPVDYILAAGCKGGMIYLW